MPQAHVRQPDSVKTQATLGPVKVGTGLLIDQYGVLSTDVPTIATTSVAGAVIAGDGLAVTPTGVLSVVGGGGAGVTATATLSQEHQIFGFDGVVTPTVGLARWYPSKNVTLNKFYASIEYAPVSDVTLQLNKNGAPIGDPIVFSAGAFKSTIVDLTETLVPADYLTVDIVSGNSGASIYATVVATGAATITTFDASGVLLNASASGVTKNFPKVAHGFTVGTSIARVGGEWVLASAATDTTAEVAGIVSVVVDADNFTLTFVGYASGFTGLTDGTVYFLSATTDGGYEAVSPSAVNTVSKPIFLAISATEAIVMQSRGIIN